MIWSQGGFWVFEEVMVWWCLGGYGGIFRF